MGTYLLEPSDTPENLTFLEVQDVPDTGCNLRFARHFFSPMMVSNLTRPMTPLNFVQFVDSLLSVNLMVGSMTAAAPLRPSRQTFNVFLASCKDVAFTEVELISQIAITVPWISTAVRKLNAFQQWPPNWNEGNAETFDSATLDTARDILQKAWDLSARYDLRTKPNIVPLEDGSVRFEWVNKDKELFLTVIGKLVEAQRWQPLDAVESEEYQTILLSALERELEWLAA